jgi:hypothetical protein
VSSAGDALLERYWPIEHALPDGVVVEDMLRVIETYPWWRRVLAFGWWKAPPFRWIPRRLRGRSPYARVVLRLRRQPRSPLATLTRLPPVPERGGDHAPNVPHDQLAASPLFRRKGP